MTKTKSYSGTQTRDGYSQINGTATVVSFSYSGGVATLIEELDEDLCVMKSVASGTIGYTRWQKNNQEITLWEDSITITYGGGQVVGGVTTNPNQGVKATTIIADPDEPLGTTYEIVDFDEEFFFPALAPDSYGYATGTTATNYTNSLTNHESDEEHTANGAWSGTVNYEKTWDWEGLTLGRYRWVIPHDFDPPPEPSEQKWHGTWHKIEFEEIFSPEGAGGDIVTEKSIEWDSGGGTLIDFSLDGDYTDLELEALNSWKTEYIETETPTEDGGISVVMKRSQCYHGAPWVYH